MRQHWLNRAEHPDIVLVFGGWALGAAPFQDLTGAENVLLVEGYDCLDDPLPVLAQFDHVQLLAFSFGVASAAHWMQRHGVRPDRMVAVSGTLHPTSAEYGIAPEIVRATAEQLSQASFAKFCRRAGMAKVVPELDIASAQAELWAISKRGSASDPGFDRIWIPTQDRVIPTKSQDTAWAGRTQAVKRINTPHVPFLAGQSWADWLS